MMDERPPDPEPPDFEVVVSKPTLVSWLGAGFWIVLCGLTGGLIVAAANDTPAARWTAAAFVALPLSLFAGSLVLAQLRSRFVADTQGLQYRRIGAGRFVRWDEVTDYYYRTPASRASRRAVVETRTGKVVLSADMSDYDALRSIIARRATTARARDWAVFGTRPEDDWPQEFGYDTEDNRLLPWIAWLGTFVIMGLGGAVLIPGVQETAADLGWPMALAELLLGGVEMLCVPLLLLALTLPDQRETRKRRLQTLRVDREGICWRDGREQVSARWDEVTDYYFGPDVRRIKAGGPAVVVTRHGTFDFLPTLHNAVRLREIIRLNAASARANEWRNGEPECRGTAGSRRSSGGAGVGTKLFHYRTDRMRPNLWMAVGAWLAWVGGTVSTWLVPLPDDPTPDPMFRILSCGLMTAALLWCLWRYTAAGILVDDQGITQRTWNGVRFLFWAEVEEYGIRGAEGFRYGVVTGGGKQVRFWLGIADVEALMQEIRARAPHARAGKWELRGPE